MKKVIGILALIGIVGAVVFSGKKTDDPAQTPNNPQPALPNNSVQNIIKNNEGLLINDNAPNGGYWAVVENGKARVPREVDYTTRQSIKVDFPFWLEVTSKYPELVSEWS